MIILSMTLIIVIAGIIFTARKLKREKAFRSFERILACHVKRKREFLENSYVVMKKDLSEISKRTMTY